MFDFHQCIACFSLRIVVHKISNDVLSASVDFLYVHYLCLQVLAILEWFLPLKKFDWVGYPPLVKVRNTTKRFCTVNTIHFRRIPIEGSSSYLDFWENIITFSSKIQGFCGKFTVGVAKVWGVRVNFLPFLNMEDNCQI